MAQMMQFDLVSPERKLASLQASEVQIPGAEGDMTAMAEHAPTITTLRPGILSVTTADGVQKFAVTGGFAEITEGATSVLAERAIPVAEVTADVMDTLVAEAEAAHAAATPDAADATAKLLADMVAVRTEIGV